MLDTLNDDCLLEVFNKVGLKDLIAAAQVMPRFALLIDIIWARRYKQVKLDIKIIKLENYEFRIFLASICGTVQLVHLKCMTRSLFAVLLEFTYNQAVDFRFSQSYPLFLTDNDILAMQVSFPNLKTFNAHGSFSGRYMERWYHMENLWLSSCRELQWYHLCETIGNLQLKTLSLNVFDWTSPNIQPLSEAYSSCFNAVEVLILSSSEFNWLAQKATTFPSLKQLTISDKMQIADVFSWLQRFKANDILELETAHMSLLWPAYGNLKKLTIVGQLNTECLADLTNAFNSGHLLQLRQVLLSKCLLQWDTDILNFLRLNQHIEMFSMEFCRMEFQTLRLDVHELILPQRTTPLTINFYSNAVLYIRNTRLKPVTIVGNSFMLNVTGIQRTMLARVGIKAIISSGSQ